MLIGVLSALRCPNIGSIHLRQVEFTYVAAAPELSGYKDVDFEREMNLATQTQIERYVAIVSWLGLGVPPLH